MFEGEIHIGARDPWAFAALQADQPIDWRTFSDPTAELEQRLGLGWSDMLEPTNLASPVHGVLLALDFRVWSLLLSPEKPWGPVTFSTPVQNDWCEVVQGTAKDCFLLAPMMALAWTNRVAPLRVVEHPCGAQVEMSSGPVACSVNVPVDAAQTPTHARRGWVSLREKAWLIGAASGCAAEPAYDALQDTGYVSEAMVWHLGQGEVGHATALDEATLERLESHCDPHGRLRSPWVLATRSESRKLASGHAYAVLGLMGEALVLADPWAFADGARISGALHTQAQQHPFWGEVMKQRRSVVALPLEEAADAAGGLTFARS